MVARVDSRRSRADRIPGRTPAESASLRQRILGRDAEIGRLVQAFDRDRAIVVTGEAGIGKTALVRAAIADSGRRAFEGGGFATLAWMPYLALTRATSAPISGDASTAAAAVERIVGPDILFIDDVQWVDEASRVALERLADRIVLVAAVREGDPGSDAAVALLTGMGAEAISLAGLGDEDAAALVRRVRPDSGPVATADLVRRAAGNPLLLEELARGSESASAFGRALEARREALAPDARGGLDLLAIAGRPLPRKAVPGAADLIRAGLALAGGEQIEIRHALLAESIRASLVPEERRAAHEAAARIVDDPAERSRHLLDAGDASAAAEAALSALPATSDPRQRAALLVVAAEATGSAEHRLAAANALTGLSDYSGVLAVLQNLPGGAATSIIEEADVLRARATFRTGRATEAWEMVSRAREEQRDPSSKAAARLASEVGGLLINLHADPSASLAYLERQLPNFPAASPDWYRVAALLETVRLYNGLRPDLDLMVRAAEDGLRTGEIDAPGRIINVYKAILVERGARAGLEYAISQIGSVERLGFVTQALDLRAEATQSAIYAGEFPTALAMADLVLELPASFRARHQAAIRRADALACLGEFELARASVAEAAPSSHGDRLDRAEALMSSLEIAYWGGLTGQAAELADSLGGMTADIEANLALPLLTGAWADLDLGRLIRRVPLVDFPALAGLPHEVAGIHCLATGASEDAAARFDTAAERWSGFIEPRALVCRWAAGEALRRAGATGACVERLRSAEVLATAMRFAPLLARIRRSLRLAGVRVAASSRPSAPAGLELTPRELELARLVEQGLSNIEIARRLGLGRPTVARMMASAMGKLGVDRRAQLAARELV